MAVTDEEIILRLRAFKGHGTNLSRTAANRIEQLREELRRIVALDPTRPIGNPPDPFFFIRQAQGIAAGALSQDKRHD